MNELTTTCKKAAALGYEVFEFPSGIGADIDGHRLVWITQNKESRLVWRNNDSVPSDLKNLLND